MYKDQALINIKPIFSEDRFRFRSGRAGFRQSLVIPEGVQVRDCPADPVCSAQQRYRFWQVFVAE